MRNYKKCASRGAGGTEIELYWDLEDIACSQGSPSDK